MTQFTIAISSMQTESCFARRYSEGIKKSEYWDPTYEDTMNLIARLPRVAAYIYRRTYHDGNQYHLPTGLLRRLTETSGESTLEALTRREYALIACAAGAALYALLPLLLTLFGTRWRPGVTVPREQARVWTTARAG